MAGVVLVVAPKLLKTLIMPGLLEILARNPDALPPLTAKELEVALCGEKFPPFPGIGTNNN
jgi:hypothetical protein